MPMYEKNLSVKSELVESGVMNWSSNGIKADMLKPPITPAMVIARHE